MPVPTPDPEESRDDFLDRCMADSDTAEEGERRTECELSWDDAQDTEDAPPEGRASRRGSQGIKEIRQEKAELMGRELTLKREARNLLTRTMDEERGPSGLVSGRR